MKQSSGLTERPILYTGQMVRAILEGRKTQTRRVVKPQPRFIQNEYLNGLTPPSEPCFEWPLGNSQHRFLSEIAANNPYGDPGDRLWVRHAWYHNKSTNRNPKNEQAWDEYTRCVRWPNKEVSNINDCRPNVDDSAAWRKRPSIHMPRWASCITLEIVNIRIERLQDITVGDAWDEGCPSDVNAISDWFIPLWDSINHQRGFGWDKNPWVWVIEFKRLQGCLKAGVE